MKLRQILFPAAMLLISLQIAAQDLIYKRNGELVKARILNTTGKSLSYQLYPPADSLLYYINFTAIDSIIYRNGEKAAFIKDKTDNTRQRKNPDTYYNHHLIGFDLAAFLRYHNLTLSYEYLPGKANIGFKVACALNTSSEYGYGDYNYTFNSSSLKSKPDWITSAGINYYFFPPGTFRIGAGVYYLFCSYTLEQRYPMNSLPQQWFMKKIIQRQQDWIFAVFITYEKILLLTLDRKFPSF